MGLIAVWAALALAQDPLEAFADTLEPAGASGILAGLLRTEPGRRAVLEKVESLVAARTARLDRDPQSPYEDWFFRRDERGAFHLRPERKEDLERLAARTAAAPARMAAFFRRCDAFAGRISGDGDLEKRARAAWMSPTFRAAYFNLRAGELQERDREALIREAAAEPREELQERTREIELCRASYHKLAADVPDAAARKVVSSDAGLLLILARLLRQAGDGSERCIGGVAEGADGARTVTFNLPLADLAAFVREGEALYPALPADLDSAGRAIVAERVLCLREAQEGAVNAVFEEIVADGFEEEGDRLRVRKGRYVDGDGNESPDALDGEHRGLLEAFRSHRTSLDQVVELLAEPAEGGPFADAPATFVVFEHQAEVVEAMRSAIRDRSFELFTELYLEKKGERWTVRPERAARVDEMARRAEEIRKESDNR
jgi:hypothetical protein